MSPNQARQLIKHAGFDALEDLLAPAIAIRPRVLYAAEPKFKRGRWRDWLFKPSSEGPAVQTVPVLDDLALPIGLSRFDSVPDVPIGFEWPCTTSGELMECVAQFNLGEIHKDESTATLPANGWLVFFLGFDSGACENRVVYIEPGTPLTRWSTHVPREHTRRTCRLEFETRFGLPDAHDWCVRQRIEFVGSRTEPYVKLQEQLTDNARHYLLGYPRAVQDDVRAAAARIYPRTGSGPADPEVSARAGNDWQLLLQLDSETDDDGPGWMWGDAGSVYFLIRKDDLRAGRFERTRLVLQSC